ncbi:MAG: hypothetical protein ACI4XW_00605, partial [Candidatus Spyradocola sp.]
SQKMNTHLLRIAEKFAHGDAAHEFFCIGSDFPSANGSGTDETEELSVFILPNQQKIAPRRGTRPRLRIEHEGAAAPSYIPGELSSVF